MKIKTLILTIISAISFTSAIAQEECIGGENPDCNSAQGFCTEMPDVTYCNIQSPNLGRYSCLGSTPNAMWLYMQVEQSGVIDVTVSQTSNAGRPIDVDFALYGPYTSLAQGCGTIGPNTPTVDCSYSASATEQVNIEQAQQGEFYVLLVTNYNGAAGSVSFSNNSSSGATDCDIIQPCAVSTDFTTDVCAQGIGTVTANPSHGLAPYTFSWNTPGSPTTPTVTGLSAGTYQVTMTTDDGCTATSSVTVTNQTVTGRNTTTQVSCTGGNDGTATATMDPANGTITYLWSDGQTTQTASGLAAGTYTCTLTSSNGCTATTSAVITEITPLNVVVTNFTDVTCNRGNDGAIYLTATNGTAPYTYTWSTSASATASNASSATDLFVGTHDVNIKDAKGCIINLSHVINEPLPLSITAITPDTQVCPENTATLNVTVSGGSSPYIYKWTSNGIEVGTTAEIIVQPITSGTQYCVEITEECGISEAINACLIVTHPTPIPPQLTLASYEECTPGVMVFENTSPNINELATTYIDFGDLTSEIFENGDGGSHNYITPKEYTLTVINTSVYGCVYSAVFDNYFKIVPAPTARFNFNNNPTSVFETTVPVYNKSTEDVIEWKWLAPGSTPSTSSLENPILKYPEGEEIEYPVTLIVKSFYGCYDTLTLNLKIEDQVLFFAPNSFTPNGDEFNNNWKLFIKGIDVYNFSLTIFNRWGEAIFESFDAEHGWDGSYNGKIVETGQYSWKATVRNKNNDGKTEFNGYINVLK